MRDQNLVLAGDQSKLEIKPLQVEVDGQVFKVEAKFDSLLLLHSNPTFLQAVLQYHLSHMLHRSLKLQRISGSLYNPSLQVEQPLMGINIWSGYQWQLKQMKQGLFLQVKTQKEVVRTQ